MRSTRLYLSILILLGYLGFIIPSRVGAERNGVKRVGVIVRYESSFSGRYFYPIVRIERFGQAVDLKSADSWWLKSYDIGDQIPVLDTGGRRVYVGTFFRRWSDVLFAVGALSVCGVFLSLETRRRRDRDFASVKRATAGDNVSAPP
jgi:hypothetical protein